MGRTQGYEKGRAAAYGIALTLAMLAVWWQFPPAFIIGEGAYFQTVDAGQHASGFMLYVTDAWRYPLLHTRLMNAPEGTSIALTDSIPLAALLIKPFAGLLPEGFHPIGFWHVAVRTGQAMAAVYVLRGLGHRGIFAAFLAAGFALLSPAMLHRIDHAALSTHAIVLTALGFYLRATLHGWSVRRLVTAFMALITLALLVHPYLMAMVAVLYGAALLDRWTALSRTEPLWRASARFVVPVFIGMAAFAGVAFVMGYFGQPARALPTLPHFSMNLSTFWCGGTALSLCPMHDATGGQYEGQNYLGLGTTLLVVTGLAVALVRSGASGRLGGILSRHAGLVIACLMFTAYALSNHVYLFDRVVLAYELPDLVMPVAEIFRVAGRFFWPVGYLFLFLALAGLLGLSSRTAKRPVRYAIHGLLLALLALQYGDVRSILAAPQARIQAPDLYEFSGWQRHFPDIEQIAVYPPYGCTTVENQKYVYFQLLAGHLGVPINSAYTARPAADCSAEASVPSTIPPGRLTVLLNEEGTQRETPAIFARAISRGDCAQFSDWNEVLLCMPGVDRQRWAGAGPDLIYPAPAIDQ
jgi:hypothetical protein